MTVRSVRNNNPGNIDRGSSQWEGAVPGNDSRFETFATPEHGVRAMTKTLYTYQDRHRLSTVNQMVSRWAPPTENNTAAYVNSVASAMGVDPNQPVDLRSNPELAERMITSMIRHEGGAEASTYFNDDVVAGGIALANNTAPPSNTGEQTAADAENPDQLDPRGPDQIVPDTTVNRNTAPVTGFSSTKLQENWLSTVNLGTYKWTLYLVKSNVWNSPESLNNDTAVLNAGNALIVAETGVDSTFNIENMLMLTRLIESAGDNSAALGTFQFDLIETMGFTFVDRLLVFQKSFFPSGGIPNALFVLKLEFLGKDSYTDKPVKWPGQSMFYPCTFQTINATVDGGGSKYNIIAMNSPMSASQHATIAVDLNVQGVDTIESFATELELQLNNHEREIRSDARNQVSGPPPVRKTWKVEFDASATNANLPDANGQAFNLANQSFGTTADQASAGMLSANTEDPNYRDATINSDTNIANYVTMLFTRNCPGFAAYARYHSENSIKSPFINTEVEIKHGDGVDSTTFEREKEIIVTVGIIWTYTARPDNPQRAVEQATSSSYQNERFGQLPIAKSYRYNYSGETTELIDFTLEYNNLFVVAQDPGFATRYEEPTGSHGSAIVNNTTQTPNAEVSEGNTTASRISSATYLSDVKIDQDDIVIEIPSYSFQLLGGNLQNANDQSAGNVDGINAVRDLMYAGRSADFLDIEFQIRGDPFWMGTPGAISYGTTETLLEYARADSLIAFVNYHPKEAMMEPGYRGKADMDLASSGVYRVTDVESRFQNGSFVQTLKGFRDTRTTASLVKNHLANLTSE